VRDIDYLSPTAVMLFMNEGAESYYARYLSDERPPRDPQSKPMAAGSAFDAYAKSYLYEGLFGTNNPKFEFKALFEAQVETHNRDWALLAGKYAFECYKKSGALSDLMLILESAQGEPKFETEIRGVVNGQRESDSLGVCDMVLLGKPDLEFVLHSGVEIVFDWKLNGFCSNSAKSPQPGYIKIRDTIQETSSRNVNGSHPDCVIKTHKGVRINGATTLEKVEKKWATQLAMYAWILGRPIGGDFIVAVDQLVGKPSGFEYPWLRVAEHRLLISESFQKAVFATAWDIWRRVKTKHFFPEMTFEESKARTDVLDKRGLAFKGETENDEWLRKNLIVRRPW